MTGSGRARSSRTPPETNVPETVNLGQGEFLFMAELNIRERQAGDITILDMDGKITIGEGSVALRSAIRRLLEESKKKILLNLGGVGYIDSSGIGELVSSFTAINKEGGQLKLLNLTQKLQDLLAITKLLTVFDVYESEAEALNSYN
jgi:anti-sigma B factor antagonist